MPSYRFCRPDDIPLLVAAVNSCFDVHFPAEKPFTVEDLRTEMKELDLWPSNSMVAIQGDTPIAVMIGTKREDEVLISRLGVRADDQRQGHGGHLVTSLSQKLAVLGPERLIVEVPCALPHAVTFFESLGYTEEVRLRDYRRVPAPVDPVPDELATPVTVDDLTAQDLLHNVSGRAWQRSHKTLVDQSGRLHGIGIATPVGIEAFLLFHAPDAIGRLVVVSAGCRDPARADLLLGLLFRWLAGRHSGEIVLPRLADEEVSSTLLDRLGFIEGEIYTRYATVATPA